MGFESYGDDPNERGGKVCQTFSTVHHAIPEAESFASASRDTSSLSTYHEEDFPFPAAK